MRFIVRWANGFWCLFDMRHYEPADTFGLKTQAEEAAIAANTEGRWKRMNAAVRDE